MLADINNWLDHFIGKMNLKVFEIFHRASQIENTIMFLVLSCQFEIWLIFVRFVFCVPRLKVLLCIFNFWISVFFKWYLSDYKIQEFLSIVQKLNKKAD